MSRSCKICGFFVNNETDENIGYCIANDENRSFNFLNCFSGEGTGECFKIGEGEEKELAKDCSIYFRKIKGMDTNGFVTWRVGILAFREQQKLNKFMVAVTALGVIIAMMQLYLVFK